MSARKPICMTGVRHETCSMKQITNKIEQEKTQTLNAGFSLFETLVTILLFTLVFMIVGGAFVSSLSIQRRAFNLQTIEENMNFVLEAMAKEIRVATSISTLDTNSPGTNNCASPATSLSFVHPVNGSIVYSLSGTSIQRSVNGVANPITSNTIQVTRMQFCISGRTIDDTQQPRVAIIVSFRSTKVSQRTVIDTQTTVSQRFLSN